MPRCHIRNIQPRKRYQTTQPDKKQNTPSHCRRYVGSLPKQKFQVIEVHAYRHRYTEFFDNAPEQFDAYILFADTIIGYSDFFLPRKSKIILLASEGSHLPETSMTSLDIHESEESLLEKIQQFIEHLDKQSEILPHELSPRETEVLRLVAKGLMNKEIADRLNISINTVLSHRKNLTAKLGDRDIVAIL